MGCPQLRSCALAAQSSRTPAVCHLFPRGYREGGNRGVADLRECLFAALASPQTLKLFPLYREAPVLSRLQATLEGVWGTGRVRWGSGHSKGALGKSGPWHERTEGFCLEQIISSGECRSAEAKGR